MQVAQPLAGGAASSREVAFPRLDMLKGERSLIGAHILLGLFALAIGILMGPFQTFRRSPAFMDAFPGWQIPVFTYYYQALTIHGVMNALFFTTFFIIGFTYFVVQRSLQRELWNVKLAWGAFGAMLVGLLLVLFAIGSNQANVLFTFYPTMIAHPTFYIGLVLLVVGTWMACANVFMTYASWTRDHPGERIPLAIYAIMVNLIMWAICTVPVAIEVLFMLLPLSFGWVTTTDPQLARVLFWFFGHPLVYFWLLPAYVSWYTMLPTQTKSKLFSEPLARVAFLMFLLFSIPVGVHHQFTDPGISATMKGVHTMLTFIVAVPSFLTAFNIGAMLERAGQNRGAKGPIAWMWKQDWGNPVVAAQLCGMLLFIAGGFSGLINASLTLNIALHNTSWIPGHFHQTLGGMVTLTYLGITYWMLPLIRGRALFAPKLALAQVYTWLIGMSMFGHSMGLAGLAGAPRRTDLGTSTYVRDMPHVAQFMNESAVAGAILLLSSVFLFIVVIGTLFFSNKPVTEEGPITTSSSDHESPIWLQRWWMWIGLVLILIMIAYGPVFAETIALNGFNAPVYRPESPIPLWR